MEPILGLVQIVVLMLCLRRVRLPLFCLFLLTAGLRNLAHPWLLSWSSPVIDVPVLMIQVAAAVEAAVVLMKGLSPRERNAACSAGVALAIAASLVAVSAAHQPNLLSPDLVQVKMLVRLSCGVFVSTVLAYAFRRPWRFPRRMLAHSVVLAIYFWNATVASLRPLQDREQWQASHDTYIVVLFCCLAAWAIVFIRPRSSAPLVLIAP